MTTSHLADVAGSHEVRLDDDLATFLFLREHALRGHVHVVQRELRTRPSAVPDGATLLHNYEAEHLAAYVAEVPGALLLVRAWRHHAGVHVAAATVEHARAVADAVEALVPPTTDDDHLVDVSFADASTGTRSVRVGVRPWEEVAPLYPAAVAAALGEVMAHQPDPVEARRLLVFYGAPGTGKTTAVRALLHAWRGWANGLVVSDPERLLTDGTYLRRAILDEDDDDRWQLVVLEDAEALLQTSTAATSALGKLLNLADGLLGQGLRCLFLLTTNEPVGALHPALVRPGRCLARIEFAPLSAAETARALGRPVDHGQTLAEVMAARAVGTDVVPAAVGQYL